MLPSHHPINDRIAPESTILPDPPTIDDSPLLRSILLPSPHPINDFSDWLTLLSPHTIDEYRSVTELFSPHTMRL